MLKSALAPLCLVSFILHPKQIKVGLCAGLQPKYIISRKRKYLKYSIYIDEEILLLYEALQARAYILQPHMGLITEGH